jgi:hypothetical protein
MIAPPHGSLVPPSIDILGAYFPDWMFCITGAMVLTAAVRIVAVRAGLNDRMDPGSRVFLYPAMGAVIALLGWLFFFME